MERPVRAGEIPTSEGVTKVRQTIAELLKPRVVRMGQYRWAHLDQIAEIEGIRLVERLEDYQGLEVKCAEYLFWYIKREPWCEPRENLSYNPVDLLDKRYYYLPPEFWLDPVVFLISNDYTVVEEAQVGDIVGYKNTGDERRGFVHFGVYFADGRVVSKFGAVGHVYEHGIWQVPIEYGDEVVFFRRAREESEGLSN